MENIMIIKNTSITETDKLLRSGKIKPEDFASPDFSRFENEGVVVHHNIYLTWDKINIDHFKGNPTKTKDITEKDKKKLKHNFEKKGVNKTKIPPAINPIPNEDGTHDLLYGYQRESFIKPQTAGWVFTPITIPKEMERRVLCGENEEDYPQAINTTTILAENLILDIDAGYCEKDEASIDSYLLDAYPSRTNTERKDIKDKVKTHYRRTENPIAPAKFTILDNNARINDWNTNNNTTDKMYSLGGSFDENLQAYVFTCKGEDGAIQRELCRMGEKIGRGEDYRKSEGLTIEQYPVRNTILIFHVGQAENRKNLLSLRIKALQVYDKCLKWMKQLGMDVSHFSVLGFISQESGVETGLIPVKEIRKHMK